MQAELDEVKDVLARLEAQVTPVLAGLRIFKQLGERVDVKISLFENLLAAIAAMRSAAHATPTTLENKELITELRLGLDALGVMFGTNGMAVSGSIKLGDPVPV